VTKKRTTKKSSKVEAELAQLFQMFGLRPQDARRLVARAAQPR
jgi:hypothetical protein